jgi:DNA repair protein RecN (Recombination protein N)
MLVELRVSNLGVVEELTLAPGKGMTVVTGETGAGKTMVVGAIGLLIGGRADPTAVRPGATEAVVDGRFVVGDEEIILTRVIPVEGRSRAYRNGRPITVSELSELGSTLIEIHGQHAHQQLLSGAAQRRALDTFAEIDLGPLTAAAREVRHLEAERDGLGGDERSRLRELDVLQFQLTELDEASIDDPEEDERLRVLEARLASAGELRSSLNAAVVALGGDGGARDKVAHAAAALDAARDDPVLAAMRERLKSLTAEVADLAGELRAVESDLVDDPAALAAVQQRRRTLTTIRRKYGATLAEVISTRERLHADLLALENSSERRAAIDRELASAQQRWAEECERVGAARRSAAPALAEAVSSHLAALGMPQAQFAVAVDGGRGDEPDSGSEVTFLIAANPGVPLGPLSKVASGGELSRTMLALRLVLSEGPPLAVFDEVDAGIGGEAALRVADALGGVADNRQVLVVTHLAQVAARAPTHVRLTKSVVDGMTLTSLEALSTLADREAEIARMLSGSPGSDTARQHAAELLRSGK